MGKFERLKERALRITGQEVPAVEDPSARVRDLRRQVLEDVAHDTAADPTAVYRDIWTHVDAATGSDLPAADRAALADRVRSTLFGYGPLGPFLADPAVTEVMVNGPDAIFVERDRRLTRALDHAGRPLRFDPEELHEVIDRIVSPLNRTVNDSNPIVDARLPDGSRVCVVMPPVSLVGPVISIRRFPASPYTLTQLVAGGMLTPEAGELLRQLVRRRYNLLVSGGTSSGKTTLLNALCLEMDPDERLVVAEDSAELKLPYGENCIRLETRPSTPEQPAGITMRDLVRTALRLRPDRIMVGEVRGGEAFDMLVTMNTGHDGSLTTAHANSPLDMLRRLEAMVLMAGMEMPLMAIRYQITAAVDVIVQLHRLPSGERRVTGIAEVGPPGTDLAVTDLFRWEFGPGGGRLVPTGASLKRSRLTSMEVTGDDR
jgi:pilus assembly protein CpaF